MANLCIGLLRDVCIGQVSNLFLGQVTNFILSLPTGRMWSKHRYLSLSLFSGIIVVDKLTDEVSEMATITLSDILDDLEAAEQVLRKFEQRYWISSTDFYELYSQGLLDDGQHREDFSEWAGFYKIKQHRQELLRQFSEQRVADLRAASEDDFVHLEPGEPVLKVTA
jgi:hypothetical protein